MKGAPLRVEVITQPERLQAFEPEWQALFAADPRGTPFQSPDWLLPWAEAFAPPGTLRVIVLWEGPRAVCCWPLRLVEQEGQRRLGWLGEGLSDYLDVLATADAGERAFGLAWAALRELGADADRVELGDLPEGSPLLRFRGAGWSVRAGTVCPRLDPGSDLQAFQRRLPAS